MESRKLVSPPALRVYCVWNVARRAERWFEKESSRQSKLQEPRTVSRWRQPSTAVKNKFKTSDYIPITNMLGPAITPAITSSTVDGTSVQHRSKISTEQGGNSPNVALRHLRRHLSRLIWTKSEELKSRHAKDNTQCICTLAGKDLDCLDGNDCGYGLIPQSIRRVPRGRKQNKIHMLYDLCTSSHLDSALQTEWRCLA
jgi:hypothetical protein